jgi:hypothetical protein
MYNESVCQVACSWVDVGSFHTRLVLRFKIFIASVRNILDSSSYCVLYGTQTVTFALCIIIGLGFTSITKVESVYSAVRIESLYKAGFYNRGGKCLQGGTD